MTVGGLVDTVFRFNRLCECTCIPLPVIMPIVLIQSSYLLLLSASAVVVDPASWRGPQSRNVRGSIARWLISL